MRDCSFLRQNPAGEAAWVFAPGAKDESVLPGNV